MLIENKLGQPALVLIYSTMDAAASLDRHPTHKDVERSDFVRWVEAYLMPDSGLECSLYAARCGLLHAFAATSALTRHRQARTVAYAWGKAKIENLSAILRHQNRSDIVPIHITSLNKALRAGFGRYLEEVAQDDDRIVAVLERASQLYDHAPEEVVQAYLQSKIQHGDA